MGCAFTGDCVSDEAGCVRACSACAARHSQSMRAWALRLAVGDTSGQSIGRACCEAVRLVACPGMADAVAVWLPPSQSNKASAEDSLLIPVDWMSPEGVGKGQTWLTAAPCPAPDPGRRSEQGARTLRQQPPHRRRVLLRIYQPVAFPAAPTDHTAAEGPVPADTYRAAKAEDGAAGDAHGHGDLGCGVDSGGGGGSCLPAVDCSTARESRVADAEGHDSADGACSCALLGLQAFRFSSWCCRKDFSQAVQDSHNDDEETQLCRPLCSCAAGEGRRSDGEDG